jgi:hypothetical protein
VLWVVDTFEEAQRRGEAVTLTVFNMIRAIPRWSKRSKVVVSGRAKATESIRHPYATTCLEPIFLSGLHAESAFLLLTSLLRTAEPPLEKNEVKEVIATVGCNPMCLKMAARLIQMRGIGALRDPVARSALLAELKAERAQCFLFGRIVEYLPDKMKPLAYPGLIVRRITSDVIRYVLASPCKIELQDEQSAEILIAAFKDELGIVEREQDGEGLRYRSELRDELLPDLLNNVEFEVVSEID